MEKLDFAFANWATQTLGSLRNNTKGGFPRNMVCKSPNPHWVKLISLSWSSNNSKKSVMETTHVFPSLIFRSQVFLPVFFIIWDQVQCLGIQASLHFTSTMFLAVWHRALLYYKSVMTCYYRIETYNLLFSRGQMQTLKRKIVYLHLNWRIEFFQLSLPLASDDTKHFIWPSI